MTSLATFGWQLSKLKNGRKCPHRRLRCRISGELFELESPTFTVSGIHTDLPYICICTGYDDTRSELITNKSSKMPPHTTSGRISREMSLSKDHQISRSCPGQLAPINMPDMTSLVASGRLLNTIKYCTKVMRKWGPAGERVK